MPVEVLPRSAARFSRLGKRSPETEQGFPTRGNVPRKQSKVFPPGEMFLGNRARFSCLGKCSSETEQGFLAWENVPRKRSKVFPLGEMFPGNRARFSCLGKCSSETEQGFPIESTLNISLAWHVRCHGGRMRYAPTYLPFVRWGYGDGWLHLV